MTHKRIDANQKEITSLFRQLGATVLVTSELGRGAPDLIIGFRGRNIMVEVKDGKKPLSHQKLTHDEMEFHQFWRGDIRIIRCEADVISLVNEISGL